MSGVRPDVLAAKQAPTTQGELGNENLFYATDENDPIDIGFGFLAHWMV